MFRQKYDDTTFTGILVGTGQRMLRFLFDETLAGFPFTILQVSCTSQFFKFFFHPSYKRAFTGDMSIDQQDTDQRATLQPYIIKSS